MQNIKILKEGPFGDIKKVSQSRNYTHKKIARG